MENEKSTGTSYAFVERELSAAGYLPDKQQIPDAVTALFAVLDAQELPAADRKAAAQLFSALVEKDGDLGNKAGPRSVWKPFYLGMFSYGETVRVRTDAYDTPTGSRHNGLTGLFASAHAGRVYVQYHGRKDGSGHEHHPSRLEVLVKQ